MKFTLSWLKQHLDTTATVDEISRTLTDIGLEVESVTDRGQTLAQFEIAYVKEAAQHPNADRLRVCQVETRTGTIGVVCGAPNARAGIKVVLARPGMTVPESGITLKKSAIRGVESEGMLCSARELGLGEDHDGIMELPADAPVGGSFVEFMKLDDPLFDISITPNRGDCLGVRGVARDLAATGLGTLKPLDTTAVPGKGASPTTITLQDPHCSIFVGRTITGVKNGESPAWLKQRLESIGLRPISVLVDITNFFTFDLGRPLHVFDAAKLTGNITVRSAKEGETLAALNGKTYSVPAGTTLVADDAGPVGLGGIIGGEASGCTETTTTVFLEAAWFDPIQIAKTGRALAIDSDARFRFERTVDPAFVQTGAELATRLILELCGGEASDIFVAGAAPVTPRTISFRPARVKSLGGVEIPEARQREILETIGCTISGSAPTYTVTAPTWRQDIHGEADLVEEVLRIHGYHHIPTLVPTKPQAQGKVAAVSSYQRSVIARKALTTRGLTECCTFSFLKHSVAEQFASIHPQLVLDNPISADLDTLRPTLLPNLLSAATRSADRGMKDAAFCEIGAQFNGIAPKDQILVAAGVRSGGLLPRNTHLPARKTDAFDAKADALAVLEALGVNTESLVIITQNLPKWYHPSKSGALTLGGKVVLGYFGEVHPRILKTMELKSTAVAFEIFLAAIPESRAKGTAKTALQASDLPAVERDFAFMIPLSIPAADVVKAVRAADKQFIADVTVFDVFTGGDVQPGYKSLALSVRLQPKEKTFTDGEIQAIAETIVASVQKSTGAALRGAELPKAA